MAKLCSLILFTINITINRLHIIYYIFKNRLYAKKNHKI